jgi:hypothetical protein
LRARWACLNPDPATLRVASAAERGPAAPRHAAFFAKAEEPPLCVIAKPGIKLFGRDRISASDLLGADLAGRGSAEHSQLSVGSPPRIGVRKTIRPLRIVGHVSLPSRQNCRQFISTSWLIAPEEYAVAGGDHQAGGIPADFEKAEAGAGS